MFFILLFWRKVDVVMKNLLLGAFGLALSLSVQAQEVKMESPDGKYQFVLNDKSIGV